MQTLSYAIGTKVAFIHKGQQVQGIITCAEVEKGGIVYSIHLEGDNWEYRDHSNVTFVAEPTEETVKQAILFESTFDSDDLSSSESGYCSESESGSESCSCASEPGRTSKGKQK